MNRRRFLTLSAGAGLAVGLAPLEVLAPPVDDLVLAVWSPGGPSLVGSAATLEDWARRIDPAGARISIVELLRQTNELLTDTTWLEEHR